MSREKNIKTIYALVGFIEQRKIKEYSELFSENGRHINPYHSGLVPAEFVGQKEIYNFIKNTSDNFSEISFSIDEIMPFEDPNKIAARLSSKMKFKNGSGYYENDYLLLAYFDDDGKILELYEYFNPIIAARAFGLMDKIK